MLLIGGAQAERMQAETLASLRLRRGGVAVIGAGAIGLTTAVVAQRAGFTCLGVRASGKSGAVQEAEGLVLPKAVIRRLDKEHLENPNAVIPYLPAYVE